MLIFRKLSEVITIIMYRSLRTKKFKVNMDVIHSKNEIRTKRAKCLWTTFILLIVLMQASATHIDFDDVETSWLKNVVVNVFQIDNVHSSILSLKITGLALIDIQDGVHIKPTFSTSDCIGNETELQIIHNAAPSSSDSDLIVSLNNFHFEQRSEAYLCIKTKYDHSFLHMGLNSKFSK